MVGNQYQASLDSCKDKSDVPPIGELIWVPSVLSPNEGTVISFLRVYRVSCKVPPDDRGSSRASE